MDARRDADTRRMSAALTELTELLSHDLSVTRTSFETLDAEEALALLRSRFRLLSESGWDWASALMLAADVERSAAEAAALAPRVPTPLVLQ
jgi:hypothetical protein